MALLKLAGIARSTYYYYQKRMKQPSKYESIRAEIKRIYAENQRRYGYRRICIELKNRGIQINHKTVLRLMKELGLRAIKNKKKYKSYKGEVGHIAPNIINRDFNASSPNQKWATDITEFRIPAGKLYLSPTIDLYNGEIVSYSISRNPNFKQTMEMLDKAFIKIPKNTNLILHSDQGWQYQQVRYQERLREKGITQSMSREGNCLDNAVMENFFSLLKNEVFYGNESKFSTLSDLKIVLEEHID
ncbi:hypothetical protein CDQ84_18785 [Clostridium thermosuccinogenes]|uniref:Integrase catalytic domain-containing protein n=2 Tax=Clostridium thermosuccinogenes TaxID=84032 RepID=A0A2K2F6Z4_9CLOT|nr:IS3 family transposase [Pseudoclostridium thermosuccinogenes]AUS97690.1 hypothetical protein CDO33_15330 [Pseudoclostridium thermosuccinogenes]PNT91825.1 hypothetical protein CDQ85_18710 [Pseudoclostridium thermosuccinogenes]PNT94561.1 hypothetical protein CDQ84_18785 [Pseudoclostridium thermosuccinogenes]